MIRTPHGRRTRPTILVLLPIILLAGVHASSGTQNVPRTPPEKCGTPWALAVHEALTHPELLDPATRAAYERSRTRPSLQEHLDTEHFRIHYDTTGQNAILGWPATDYLDAVAAALERSWRVEVDTLGFRAPPSDIDDPGDNGGNGLYDCYLIDLGTAFYGITFVGYSTPGGPPADCTSFLEIDNDYEGFGYADPTVPMRVTVAHEFNHACQFGHVLDADLAWYMECSSVWTEDRVYDDLNDYYQFLPYYLGHPYRSLEYRGTAMYGSAVWNFFLAERFGEGVVPSVWSAMENGAAVVAALASELALLGTSLEAEFAEFAVWNWYIGARDDGAHYEEGAAWPDVTPTLTITGYPAEDVMVGPAVSPDHLGTNYVVFENPHDICESVDVAYDGPAPLGNPQAASLLAVGDSGDIVSETAFALDSSGDAALTTAGWDTLDAVVLVVANTSSSESDDDLLYTVSAEQAAPYNGAFAATVTEPLAVSLEWSLDTIEELTAVRVDRATSADGTYEAITGEMTPALSGSALDDDVIAGDDLWYRLVLVRDSGAETSIPNGSVHLSAPGELSLAVSPAMPNPFSNSTTFELALPGSFETATLRVYDITGRLVRELTSEPLAYGRHRLDWDGRESTGEPAASGVYLCSLEYDGERLTRKLTLIR